MALIRNIYGWEVGDGYGAALTGDLTVAHRYILDAATARTGCYYGSCGKPTNDTFLLTTGIIGPFTNTTVTSTGLLRCAFQIAVPVDAGDCGVLSVGSQPQSALGSYSLLQVNASNHWRIGMRAGSVSAYSALPLTTGSWYLPAITHTLVQTWDGITVSNAESVTCTCNGETLTAGPILSTGNFGNGLSHAILGFLPFAVWYSFGPQPTVGTFYFDDLTLLLASTGDLPSAVFPQPTRIRLMGVTGQGSLAQWAGAAADLTEVPVNPGGPGQTSTVAGQVTLLAHAPVATQLVPSLGATGVEVVKAYGYLSTTGSPLQTMRLNGVSYPVDISASLAGGAATPFAEEWRAPGVPFSDAALDALEFGWENATGATLVCPAIHAEILCELSAWAEPGCGLFVPPFVPPTPGEGCSDPLAAGSDSGGGVGCKAGLA